MGEDMCDAWQEMGAAMRSPTYRATTGPREGMAATSDYWLRTLDAAMLHSMRCREYMAEDLFTAWEEMVTQR